MLRKKGKLYKLGWPKDTEIKANIMHSLKWNKKIPIKIRKAMNGDEFIKEFLLSLKRSCRPRIDYIVVNKDGLRDESFRNAPYGIAYNFFAGKILVPIILEFKDCYLTVDKRNKEIHTQRHFDGYIETKARGSALEKGISIKLTIDHAESQTNYGLQAVDFLSWSIYRKIENNDSRFFKIFEDLIKIKEEWYCE